MSDEWKFLRIEYDLSYWGGQYDGVGKFAYVPLALCKRHGTEDAFRRYMGHDPVHIVHYSPDEIYDGEGNILKDEASKASFILAVYTCEIEGCCDSYFWQIQDDDGYVVENSDKYTNKFDCRQGGKERLLYYRSAKPTGEQS